MFLDLTPTQKIARKGHKKPGKVKKKAPNEVKLKKKQKNMTVLLKLNLIVYTGRS